MMMIINHGDHHIKVIIHQLKNNNLPNVQLLNYKYLNQNYLKLIRSKINLKVRFLNKEK
jgi:hypothetical protein